MDAKELFRKYGKSRVTIIKRTRNERATIKRFLRDEGFTDIVEHDDFEQAWDKLQLATTNALIFSVTRPEGMDFLRDLIESTRFSKTPMVIFTDKIAEHPKLFTNADIVSQWAEAPMNSLKVEQALAEVLERGVVEKSQVADESVALNHFTNAIKAMEEEEYEDAKELLRLALKENPNFFPAYVKMSEALMELDDYECAGRVITRVVSMRPDDPGALLLQAKLAVETQSEQDAIRALDNVVAKRPNDLMFIIEIGNLALEKGWIDQAIRYFEMAKNIDPNLIHVYNRLGIAYSRAGKFDNAMDMYQRALKIDENDAGIHFNIGMTFYRKGDNANALESFTKADTLDTHLEEAKAWIKKVRDAS